MPLTRSSPSLPGALAVAAAALLLPACGGGGESSRPQVATIEITGDAKKAELKAPATMPGGIVQIDLKNASKGPRDAQFVRVTGNQTPQDVEKVVSSEGGPIPDWLEDGGGVGTTPPGQTAAATQNLEPGRYIVFSAPEGEGQQASAEVEVEGGSPGELPKTEAELIARDYTFEAKGLKPGKQKVLFKNEGRELHHVIGAPLMPGKTIDDVRKFVSEQGEGGEPSGPPPIDFENGFSTAVIDGGVEQVVDVDVKKPGKYAMVCFIQDRKGGPPHVMKGMLTETDIR
jgi:hypothetical protein